MARGSPFLFMGEKRNIVVGIQAQKNDSKGGKNGYFDNMQPVEILAWLLIIIGSLAIAWFLFRLYVNNYVVINPTSNDLDVEKTGQVGDFIGGFIGALWTLAGVLLYFSALKLQNQQLKQQQTEIDQNKRMMNQQQFETTFFNLLDSQQNMKNHIQEKIYYCLPRKTYLKSCVEKAEGGLFFTLAKNELKKIYNALQAKSYLTEEDGVNIIHDYEDILDANDGNSSDFYPIIDQLETVYVFRRYRIELGHFKRIKEINDELHTCRFVYFAFYNQYDNSLGSYCRHLYNIVKYVDQEMDRELSSSPDELKPDIEKRRKLYIDLIHSTLTTSELVILFYNALIYPKAQELFVKYNLFENLTVDKLIKKEHAELIPNADLKTTESLRKLIMG